MGGLIHNRYVYFQTLYIYIYIYILGVGGITYILGDIFRSCRALFFIKTYIKRNKMLKELVHLMHFWRFAAQKCKNLLFCLRCNVNKNKNRSFWSILTFSWIKNNFQQLLFLHFFPFKASLRILIMYIYIYEESKSLTRA